MLFEKRGNRYFPANPENVISCAVNIVTEGFQTYGTTLSSPNVVRDFVKMKLAHKEHEVFAVLFLNSQHKLIAFEEMFQGSIDSCSVYPREIVKRALVHNAAAIILTHNHPSGESTPSSADRQITDRIKTACEPLEVRVLDHIVVGQVCSSFAELGWL